MRQDTALKTQIAIFLKEEGLCSLAKIATGITSYTKQEINMALYDMYREGLLEQGFDNRFSLQENE